MSEAFASEYLLIPPSSVFKFAPSLFLKKEKNGTAKRSILNVFHITFADDPMYFLKNILDIRCYTMWRGTSHVVQRFGIYDVAIVIWVERSGTIYTVLGGVIKNFFTFIF